MNKHVVSVHERKKPFKCEICDYSCAQKRSLNIHVAAVHEGNKPFKCDQCSYSSVNKSQLKVHKAVHEGKKPYANGKRMGKKLEGTRKCEFCDYRGGTNMNRHIASVHEGKKLPKSFNCKICGYSYRQLHYIKKHVEEVHEGKEPPKSFKVDNFKTSRDTFMQFMKENCQLNVKFVNGDLL